MFWIAPDAAAICLPFGDRNADATEMAALRESQDPSITLDAAIAAARARGDHLQEARLWAAAATRGIPRGNPGRVRDALAAARRALDALAPVERSSGAARIVEQRLALDSASLAVAPAELRDALASVGALLASPDADGNARACALLVRSLKHSELGDQQSAAADAMTAYRIAEAGGFGFARADAAILLATAYRRAGLTGPASRFIADAISRAPQVGPPGMLARARYIEAQVNLEARQYDAALESLREARTIWRSLGNSFGELASDQMTCVIAVERGNPRGAVDACNLDEAELQRAGRSDMVMIQRAYAAQVALARGSTLEAARLIEAAIALAPSPPPGVEVRLLNIRARILEAQGRWREALAATRRSVDLENARRQTERVHTASLLDASNVAERAQNENRILRLEAGQAAAELEGQKLVRNLWAAAAIAAGVAVGSLLALLVFLRRRERRERRARAIFATLAANSPDALFLLNQNGQILAANRGLFGGLAPAPGQTLADAVPAATRAATLRALARATGSRDVETTEVNIDDAHDARAFELKCAPIVADGRVVGATLRATDVTEARRIERLAAGMASRERARVAGELHEGLGQELAGIAMVLTSLARQVRRGGQTDADSLDAAAATLMRSVGHARGLARDMAPVVVARRSLKDALAQLAANPPDCVNVTIAYDSESVFPDAVSDELLRLIRELVEHHRQLGGRSVDVRVSETSEGQLVLTLDLHGVRLPDSSTSHAGLDIAVIEHRIRALGATCRIEDSRADSTRLRVQAMSPRPQ
jgi:signal transduction histidine kinase